MPKSNWISSSELQQITRLIGECRELGDDPMVWRQHLHSGIARLVDADLVMSAEVKKLPSRPDLHARWHRVGLRSRGSFGVIEIRCAIMQDVVRKRLRS